VLCYYQGKYKQSEELHLGALRNLEKAYGQNNPKVAQCLDELAKTWAKMGKHDDSKVYLQRALVCTHPVVVRERSAPIADRTRFGRADHS
jgi:tetratricopeptide (TPR) repeat protein